MQTTANDDKPYHEMLKEILGELNSIEFSREPVVSIPRDLLRGILRELISLREAQTLDKAQLISYIRDFTFEQSCIQISDALIAMGDNLTCDHMEQAAEWVRGMIKNAPTHQSQPTGKQGTN